MTAQDFSNKASAIRIDIIQTVKTPLGFFALAVLVVEAILGITAGISQGPDRTYLVIGMLALIFLLVVIVAGLAIFRPEALTGTRPQTDTPSSLGKDLATSPVISAQQARRADEKFISGKNGDFIIADPRPYWNVSWKTFEEIIMEESGIADQGFYSQLQGTVIGIDASSRDILQIRANTSYEITPLPGVSRKNGLPLLGIQHPTVIPEVIIFSKNKFAS